MKKRMGLGLALIAALVIFITGGTMAWFTDKKDVENKFTAGTVKLSLLNDEFKSPDNWNPGDVTEDKITLKNDGTKAIYVRIKFEPKWDGKDKQGNDLLTTNVTYEPTDANWIKVGDYFYYKKILGSDMEVKGNIKDVTLNLKVKLKGEETGNEYQGKVYTLKAIAESVQAKNDAVQSQWPEAKDIEFEAYPAQ